MTKEEPKSIFLEENESRMNRRALKLAIWTTLVGPVMIFLRYFGIFKTVTYTALCIFTSIMVAITMVMCLIQKKFSSHRCVKYFFLLTLECAIGYLSIIQGIHIQIAYVLIPVLSCMYYKEFFTLTTSVFCYIIMVISLLIKSPYTNHPENFTQMTWTLATIVGSTIEYSICVVVAFFIAKYSRKTLYMVNDGNLKVALIQGQFIKGFVSLVESKDYSTGEHIKRTSQYVEMLCEALKKRNPNLVTNETLTDEKIKHMVQAAPLHDIGKIAVSDSILTKPGQLSLDEFGAIKLHPTYGVKLIEENLAEVEDKHFIEMAKQMTMYHHEKWDGTGYPSGIAGEKIPLCARIMAVADVLDALLSDRPYKKAYTINEAFQIMEKESGIHFDPYIIETLLTLKNEVYEIAQSDSN